MNEWPPQRPLPESSVQEQLANTLLASGWRVHREVVCTTLKELHLAAGADDLDFVVDGPPGDKQDYADVRIDIVAEDVGGITPFGSIGIECKRSKLGLGKGMVEATFQAWKYARAWNFRTTNGQSLQKPGVILLANPDVFSSSALSSRNKAREADPAGHAMMELLERFLWKRKCALLRKRWNSGTLGFLLREKWHSMTPGPY